jgi:hypothetical protein
MSFETGHPALAFTAMDWNVAWSMPGILATTERCTEVMAKPLPSFDDDVRHATQLFRLEMGHFEHRTNDMAKHAARAAPRSSSGLVQASRRSG